MAASDTYSPGLEGVIAGETAICSLDHGLAYRGYGVSELINHCSYEDVAYLLIHGELPNTDQQVDFRSRLAEFGHLTPTLVACLPKIPTAAAPMDVLRSAISLSAHDDPDQADNSAAATRRKSERLVALVPQILGALAQQRGVPVVLSRPALGFAGNLLWLMTAKEPAAFARKAFDVSLILYAEHDFNASTFAARVVTSTESDLHSAVTAAIGALKGQLHGGANERVLDIVRAAGSPDQAEAWLQAALARKAKIMGFGHRVYKTGDVRAGILKPYAAEGLARLGLSSLEQTAEVLEQGMARAKNLHPNVDWPAGRLYHALGLPVPFYTPFFVAARMAGWCAHVLEQQAGNRLIRPGSRYIGPGPRPVS